MGENARADAFPGAGTAPEVAAFVQRGATPDRTAAQPQQITPQRSSGPGAADQQEAAAVSAGAAAQPPQETAGSGRNGTAQIDQGKQEQRSQAQRTAFELRAGFVVPATLIAEINADLPGEILAQVAQDVYDTATGRHLLIPQGARLAGAYSCAVADGQTCMLVAWQRIVFPDGKALDVGATPDADGADHTDPDDPENTQRRRHFASAHLMSGVIVGVSYSQHRDPVSSVYGALSDALDEQLGLVTAQRIEKNLGISPTREIRPSYRIKVVVTKDLAFPQPYRAFDG
ncbi:hypothetical protein D8B22_13285 [Verminephrobacter aporrectodeae subsp. tuberculatae]|uniref:TrbI/VirB10 family protein n=2 Tax=Verminephrobacter aporrectodeae TaxID=1110389 RepID=UPI002244C12F|nr:TrbI/VirB10 family protein [Verminephrobacter aporrectodeae]MCW8166050.1 hypothetical protein [Verminephrobacter aporrectodeae subsp. tuberculatae]MCW8170059.1 hypothetical protein [Verminephrobacter aporrectodeae subsp. tuberculatae]